VSVSDARGTRVEVPTEDGYLRLPAARAEGSEFRVTLGFGLRAEDRRLTRWELKPSTVQRYRGLTLCDGPHLLFANRDQPQPVLVALVGPDGRLRLPREASGGYRSLVVPSVDASESVMVEAAGNKSHLTLAPWEVIRHDAAAAFVFDLIAVPESSAPAAALKP
jgi:hypothetical protein